MYDCFILTKEEKMCCIPVGNCKFARRRSLCDLRWFKFRYRIAE